jgi:hypothetical protein
MVNKRIGLGILVMVLVFGMTVVGCDFFETEEQKEEKRIQGYSGTINGTWNHVDTNNNRTGTIITISNGVGILTAIGENDRYSGFFKSGQLNIGDTIIRNIKYRGVWEGLSSNTETVYWDCEYIIPWLTDTLSWSKTYITYNTKNNSLFAYVMGDPNFGLGQRFRK